MTRRTESYAQHSNLRPRSVDPVQEQGDQPDLNYHCAKKAPEHCLGKESMIIEEDDGTNLGELTRRTELLEDVIRVVQATVD